MRILQVDAIDIQIAESEPPMAVITVMGTAATPGYTNVDLKPLEKKLSADGILDLELVGTPPEAKVPQVLTSVTASYTFKDAADLVGVLVHARTNKLTQLVQQAFLTLPRHPQIPKTILQWEEGPGKTPFVGEEGPPKTPFIGEEDPGTTPIRGEEGPGKTPFIGEEDPGTTPIRGEEDPGKTPFIGEEDPGTTPIRGEEDPGKTPFIGEEGPGKTPVAGEELNKTAAQGEEVFKNPVGEGAFTFPTGENPKTTAHPEEGGGAKPPAGEGLFDPGFRNPFGRR